jgi:hypothetical protein
MASATGFQALGRSQLRKMINLAPSGSEKVTFRFFDSVTYNPSTGEAAQPDTTHDITVFIGSGSKQETKAGAVVKTSVILTFEYGVLPRDPNTQDEVLIDGDLYKVTGINGDAMGVQCRVYATEA